MPMLAEDTDLLDVIASVQLRHDDEDATTIDCSYAGSTDDTDNTDTPSFKNGLVYRMMIQYQESDNTCSFTLTGTPIVLPM